MSQVGKSYTVLGIDPGSRLMGWGLVSEDGAGLRRLRSGVLVPPKGPLHGRLGWLLVGLRQLMDGQALDALAIEAAFVHANPRTALVLGQARGLPIAIAAAADVDVHEYAPAAVKRQVVGRGRATKEQVRRMICAQLAMDELPQEDEADALAVALTHLRLKGAPTGDSSRPLTAAQLQYRAALQAAAKRRRRR